VEVAPGAYVDRIVIDKHGITLRALPGPPPEVVNPEGKPALEAVGAAGLRVEGLRFKAVEGDVVRLVRCPGAVFVGNRVFAGTDTGLRLEDCPHAVVAGNEITRAKGDGLTVIRSEGAVILGNRIEFNGRHGVTGNVCVNLTAARNRVSDNGAGAFYLAGALDTRILENVCDSNPHFGIRLTRWTGGDAKLNLGRITVRHNFVKDSSLPPEGGFAFAIAAGGMSEGVIAHNTLVGNMIGIHTEHSNSTVCIDNLIVGCTHTALWLIGVDRMDYNNLWDNRYFVQWSERRVKTVEELNERFGGSRKDLMINGLREDPRWVDPEGGDYALREDSPCRGAASDGTDMGADWERLRGLGEKRFDFGAWMKARTAADLADEARRAVREGKRGDALAALRTALALRPDDEGLAAERKALEKEGDR
jgi:hypothetical protein